MRFRSLGAVAAANVRIQRPAMGEPDVPAARHDPREVLTRPAPPPDLTVRYGDHPDHVADVRLPAGVGAVPLVLFLHGGFWRAAYDRQHTGPLAAALADPGARPAVAVASIEFRRTGQPGGGWPGTFDDVASAVRTVPALVAAAAPGRVDGSRTVLAGHSAGGHLALWAAREARTIRGVLALAPVCDLTAAYARDLDDGAVATLLGGGPAEQPDRYAAADPMARLPLGVPMTIVHGEQDRQVPVSLARDYAAAARAAGDRVTLVTPPEAEHFGLIDPQSPVWPEVVAALAGLLA